MFSILFSQSQNDIKFFVVYDDVTIHYPINIFTTSHVHNYTIKLQ